jgi:hypothetical protein
MPVLFYENYSKSYYASTGSMSTCVCAVLTVFAVLLPFFAAFATESIIYNLIPRFLDKYFNFL